MYIWIVGGRVPVTGMLAGMNLSKPGMNLSKPRMNLSKPGKKHHNHVIIGPYGLRVRVRAWVRVLMNSFFCGPNECITFWQSDIQI